MVRNRRDLAHALLRRAMQDEALIRKVSLDADISDEVVGFHAQQAVEKQLKAVLAAGGIQYWNSHALGYLIGLFEQNGMVVPPARTQADWLSRWAVEFRYEGEDPPALDREQTLKLVEDLRTWTERTLEAIGLVGEQEERPSTAPAAKIRLWIDGWSAFLAWEPTGRAIVVRQFLAYGVSCNHRWGGVLPATLQQCGDAVQDAKARCIPPVRHIGWAGPSGRFEVPLPARRNAMA